MVRLGVTDHIEQCLAGDLDQRVPDAGGQRLGLSEHAHAVRSLTERAVARDGMSLERDGQHGQ